MKPVTTKKLNLNPETLRLLNAADLKAIVGGLRGLSIDCTGGPCGTSRRGC